MIKHAAEIEKIAAGSLLSKVKNFFARPFRYTTNAVTKSGYGMLPGAGPNIVRRVNSPRALDYDGAVSRLYNKYTPDQRLEFSEAKDKNAPHVRYSLEDEFGPAWSDSTRPMCNAVVRNVLMNATGDDILLNSDTGRSLTVADINRIADSKDRIINGYRMVPMTWEEARNHSGALVLSPKHVGIRAKNGDSWGTFNASSTKGLTFGQWGDPMYNRGQSDARGDLVKPRFFRFEKINK